MHDRQSIAYTEQLRYIGADKKDGFTLRGELPNQTVNFRFAAHVDTSGRIIQQEYIDIMMQQTCKRYLLLITSRKLMYFLVWRLAADG